MIASSFIGIKWWWRSGSVFFNPLSTLSSVTIGLIFNNTTQYNHVECLGVVHFIGGIHGVDAVNVDVLTRRRVDDAVTVVDKYASGFYLAFEFLQ